MARTVRRNQPEPRRFVRHREDYSFETEGRVPVDVLREIGTAHAGRNAYASMAGARDD